MVSPCFGQNMMKYCEFSKILSKGERIYMILWNIGEIREDKRFELDWILKRVPHMPSSLITKVDKPCAAGARSTTCHPTQIQEVYRIGHVNLLDSYATSEFQTTRSRIMEVHRIGHVNPISHYVRKSEDAQIVASSLFFTFSKKVIKTCPKPVKNWVPESACVKA